MIRASLFYTSILTASIITLSGCSTTQGGAAQERANQATKTQPAPPPPPPQMPVVAPVPVAEYQNWDGSVTYGAPAPPQPVVAHSLLAHSQAGPQMQSNQYQNSDGTVLDIIPSRVDPETQNVTLPRYILRDPSGVILREFASADEYAQYQPNPYKRVAANPVSTFSADVDTASYAMVRPYVKKGQKPPAGSVRVEEMINYFDYDYAAPLSAEQPFATQAAITPSPWNATTKLVHIGVKGFEIKPQTRPPMNLVFLVDVSGSMQAENKLPLLKKSLNILVDQLERQDRISIVTYASGEKVLLDGVRGHKKDKIRGVINSLSASGSTAGQAGMQRAYERAQAHFKRSGINRVIMATDGDFNVGISDPEALKDFVSDKRKTKVYLSMLGFGQGNLKDDRMQALAQNGNGTAGYIDSLREARKFFETDLIANTFPIADDLKIQVEFNPQLVAEYRLIGYETRSLAREDFNNDKVDAGDIGSGHSVTAIYEITPAGSAKTFVDPLRYSTASTNSADFAGEYAFVKLRYKLPGESVSKLMRRSITRADEVTDFSRAPASARWASAVAAYGLKLRGDAYMQDLSWREITRIAQRAKGDDRYGYRAEFVELTRDARSIEEAGDKAG